MADLFGETADLGENYLVSGEVVHKDGTDVTVSLGSTSSCGGMPVTVRENDVVNLATLVTKVGANESWIATNSAAVDESFLRDGSVPMTGNADLGGNKLTNLATGTAAADGVRLDQVLLRSGVQGMLGDLDLGGMDIENCRYIKLGGSATAAAYDLDIENGANVMVYDGTLGRMGIGTQSPADILHVAGTGGDLVFKDSTGRLGIGTDSPSHPLHVVGTNGFIVGQDNATDATIKSMRLGAGHYTNAEEPMALLLAITTSSANAFRIGGGTSIMNAATEILFYTSATNTTVTGTERMRITGGGDVGIGTAPSEIFHVSGTGGDLVFTEATGRLGVGTTSPGQFADFTESNSGGTTGLRIENTAAAANSSARFVAKVAAGGEDAYLRCLEASGESVCVGLDSSAAQFQVCDAAAMGSQVALGIDLGPTNDAHFAAGLAVGRSSTSAAAQMHITQPSSIGAIPVLELDQDDTDQPFIEFETGIIGNTGERDHRIDALAGGGNRVRVSDIPFDDCEGRVVLRQMAAAKPHDVKNHDLVSGRQQLGNQPGTDISGPTRNQYPFHDSSAAKGFQSLIEYPESTADSWNMRTVSSEY